MIYPITKIRSDFTIFSKKINNYPIVYLDNAATSQKPKSVINTEMLFNQKSYASIHRGVYTLSDQATTKIENIRIQIAKFINAKSSSEIIFTKNTTEGINFISNIYNKIILQPGDNIILTEIEHHSNILPWIQIAKEKNIILQYIPLLPNGTLDVIKIQNFLNEKTKLVSITQLSNVLGIIPPIQKIIKITRERSNAHILIDGAQGITHQIVDVQKLDCDFYVFSSHKLYGPSGLGVLFGKEKILNKFPPSIVGGGMVNTLNLKNNTFTYNNIPWRFEAGTPHISGIIGLGAAIQYIKKIGQNNIFSYEKILFKYTLKKLRNIPNIKIYGNNHYERRGIISFNLGSHNSYDVGVLLNQYGISIRTGHLCCIPIMNYFNVDSMCRISIAMYNTTEDIDNLIKNLIKINNLLK